MREVWWVCSSAGPSPAFRGPEALRLCWGCRASSVVNRNQRLGEMVLGCTRNRRWLTAAVAAGAAAKALGPRCCCRQGAGGWLGWGPKLNPPGSCAEASRSISEPRVLGPWAGLSAGAPGSPSAAPGSTGWAVLSPGFVSLRRTSWGCSGSLGSFSRRCMRRCGGSGRPGQHQPCACPAPSPCSCGVSGSAASLPSLVTPWTDFSVPAQPCNTTAPSQLFPFELEI